MAIAVFMSAIMDASIKRLSGSYLPFEMSCLRCLAALAILMPFVAVKSQLVRLRPYQPFWHALRGLLGLVTTASFVYAVGRLSLGSTYAIFLCAPMIIAVISATVLRHRVSLRQWTSLVVGLGGVLLVIHPSASEIVSISGIFAAVVSTLAYSLNLLIVPAMSNKNSSISLVFWFLLLVGVASAILAAPNWRRVGSSDYLWLAVIGVTGVLCQYLNTRALQLAPAFVVAPLEYTAIVWALVLDCLFWSRELTAANLIGGALILFSGGRVDIPVERRNAT